MTIDAGPTARGWRVAVSSLGLVTIAAYGVAYYSYGVLIDPIRSQTGWSSPALGAIFSGVLIIGGAGGLAGGRLVDRVGTRPAFLLAGTVGAGAVAAASYQHGLLSFGVLYAVGCGLIAALGFYHVTQPAAIRVSADAPDRAVVWLTILGAFASPIFLPLTAALVNAIGWRDTIRVLAAIAAAVFLPMAVLEGTGTRPAQASQHADGAADAFRGAWHVPGFQRWVLASLISGGAVDVILVYQVPVMIAAGLPIGAAATIGGIRGFAQLGGRIPLSPLLRRLGARRTVVLSLVVAAVITLLLLAGGHVAAAVIYSILAGASIGAMYTLQGIYTNELVGHANLSLLMGAQAAVFAVGGAAGPVLAGALFAATNSYVIVVLLTAAGLLIAAAIMSTPTLLPPRRSSGALVSAAEPAAERARVVGEPLS
jgi:MFS family permease